MGLPPVWRNRLRCLALSALAAAAAACGTVHPVAELDAVHDAKTYAHVPDEPRTLDRCLDALLALAGEEPSDEREAALAVFALSRAATEDSAALHRVHACRALGRMAGRFAEDDGTRSGPSPTEGEVGAALQRLREIHGTEKKASHASDGEAVECAALFRRLGEYRILVLADPGPVGYARDLRLLRGTLLGVLSESRGESGLPGGGEAERAVRRLAVQVCRTSVAGSILHDLDPRVRAEAARAAGAFGGGELAAVIASAAGGERDARARRPMVEAAGALAYRLEGPGRDAALGTLLRALDDDDRGIRFAAREALKALAGEDLGESPAAWERWRSGGRERP